MTHVKVDRCDLPKRKPKLIGTIWVCSCGKAWTLQPVAVWGELRARMYSHPAAVEWYAWPRAEESV